MRNWLILFFCFTLLPLLSQVKNHEAGFIENKGQITDANGKPNPRVKYLLNTNGLNVQLRENGFSYDIYEVEKKPSKTLPASLPAQDSYKDSRNHTRTYHYHRIDIDFENANNNVALIAEEILTGYDNYYNVAHAPNGVLNVQQFRKVTYRNIYNDIDIVFFIPDDVAKPVEYNFIIRPGGKITDIQLKFRGAKTELVDNKIKMKLRFGQMEETLPSSWCENGTEKKECTINYKKLKKNVYGFDALQSQSGKTIVIDPVPIRLWGSYFYGDVTFDGKAKAVPDNADNLLLSGSALINMNIATSGAFVTTADLTWGNGFLTKFSTTGQRLWTTYIANGPNYANIKDCAVNSNNDIYLVGVTGGGQGTSQSDALATSGSHKEHCDFFYSEAFIVKFDSNGLRLWGTFFGGGYSDTITTIALDTAENLIIGGYTRSSDQIATPGSFQDTNPIGSRAVFYEAGFFSKFTATGNQLYGSYFNKGIDNSAVDSDNNIYFTGQYTIDSDYPNIATSNAFQQTCNGTDIFLTKFNSSFTQQWCTYYGGTETTTAFNNSDRSSAVCTDNNDDIYLIGTTSSPNNIASSGSFKDALAPGKVNSFVAKFDGSGNRIWGTYYGPQDSNTADTCESGSINKATGEVYIIGNTRNTAYYGGATSFQPSNRGSDECFISKINTSGSPIWSTYYGTPSQDYSSSIFYKNNAVYCSGTSTGIATAGNNLGTVGAFMPNGGGWFNFVASFRDCLSSPQITSNSPVCIGNMIQLSASGGTNYSWTGPSGFTSSLSNPSIPFATVANSGQYICNLTGTGGCDGVYRIMVNVSDTTKPVPNLTVLPNIIGDCTTVVTAIPGATDNCVGAIVATTTDPLGYTLPGTYTIHWKYDDGNGNIEIQNQTVTISDVALPAAMTTQSFCIQQNATLSALAVTGQNIKWYDAPIMGNLLPDTTLLVNGTTYYASQTIATCESLRIAVAVNITDTPAPAGSSIQTFCAAEINTIGDISAAGANLSWYSSPTGTSVLPDNTLLVEGASYYGTQTTNSCESAARMVVMIHLITSLNATDYAAIRCDDLNDEIEFTDLASYNTYLIANAASYTFEYYTSLSGAISQVESEVISDLNNYQLILGVNTIYVRIRSNECFQVVRLDLTLVSTPVLSIPDMLPICERTTISVDAGPGFDSYLWSTGSTASSITVASAGDYAVTVTQQHGDITCTTTKNFTVVLSGIATITSIETQDFTVSDNNIIVNATGYGDYEFSIDGIHYQSENTLTGLSSGTYTVYVRDKNGCGVANEKVFLLMYPKFFTPNGDGMHDVWLIALSYLEPGLKVNIFDRYGKYITTLDNSNSWDGTYNQRNLPADDYWFVVTRLNGEELKGHFTLKR